VFAAWDAFTEHRDRRRVRAELAPIQRELEHPLRRAARKSVHTRHHRRLATNLLKVWPALWTFLAVDGVEPTNNAAERSLRGPVIHRKLSHATRSDAGERFIERALSASLTCRLQGRSPFPCWARTSDLRLVETGRERIRGKRRARKGMKGLQIAR
jgi:transposase